MENFDVEGLSTRFGSDDAAGRDAAVTELLEIDKLASIPSRLRLSVTETLGRMGDARAVEPLLNTALKDWNKEVRTAAVHSLGLIGDEGAIRALVAVFTTPRASVQEAAALALASTADPRATDFLVGYIEEKTVEGGPLYSAHGVMMAMKALSRAGDIRGIGPLMEAYAKASRGGHGGGMSEIEQALLSYRGADAARAIIAALDKDGRHGVGGRALVNIGRDATSPLIEALKHGAESVRSTAASVLGKIGDAGVTGPLIAALKDKSEVVRSSAAYALGGVGGLDAVEPLAAALKDPSQEVRNAAAIALGEMGGAPVVEPLIRALQSGSSFERRVIAAESLGRIGDARAVAPLIASLDDKSQRVRIAAAGALGKIGTGKAVEPLLSLLENCHDIREVYQVQAALRGIKVHEPAAVTDVVENLRRRREDELRQAEVTDGELEGGLLRRLEHIFIEVLGVDGYRDFCSCGYVSPGSGQSLISILSSMFRIDISAERLHKYSTLRECSFEILQNKESLKLVKPWSYLDIVLDTL